LRKETDVDQAAHLTVPRRRLRVAVTTVAVLATLTVGTTGAAAAPPTAQAAAPPGAGTGPTRDTEPRTLTPGFLLDRGRYRGFDAPQAQLSTLP
jgi:ABC-type amino acid transport substrate-binding protein